MMETDLRPRLKAAAVDTIYVCGLATDVCVLYTVLDALEAAFNVIVLVDACVRIYCTRFTI